MHLNERQYGYSLGIFIVHWQSRERLAFEIRQKFKGERFGAEPTVARYICVRVRVDASALSVENISKVSHFLPSFRFPDGVRWNVRHEPDVLEEKQEREVRTVERDEKKSRRKKDTKKRSRKDVASYISNALLEISERQELGAEENLDGKGEEEEYSREEKSNPLQCISGQVAGGGVLACGERKSRFEKMKFVPWCIPVSIFTVYMCSRVCTRARVFHVSTSLDYFYRTLPGTRDTFSLPINHAAWMAKTNLNSTIERA